MTEIYLDQTINNTTFGFDEAYEAILELGIEDFHVHSIEYFNYGSGAIVKYALNNTVIPEYKYIDFLEIPKE